MRKKGVILYTGALIPVKPWRRLLKDHESFSLDGILLLFFSLQSSDKL